MMQDIDPQQMANGNSLTADAFKNLPPFDFILANPPYGVDWKGYAGPIRDEHATFGYDGRFGAGVAPGSPTARCCSCSTCCRR